jgi:hypothetical protein
MGKQTSSKIKFNEVDAYTTQQFHEASGTDNSRNLAQEKYRTEVKLAGIHTHVDP